MLIYRNVLLIIFKQNSLKSQENVNTKCVSVIQLLSMDLQVRFGNLLKVRFGNSTEHPYLLSLISADINMSIHNYLIFLKKLRGRFSKLYNCICFPIILMFRSGISVSFR